MFMFVEFLFSINCILQLAVYIAFIFHLFLFIFFGYQLVSFVLLSASFVVIECFNYLISFSLLLLFFLPTVKLFSSIVCLFVC